MCNERWIKQIGHLQPRSQSTMTIVRKQIATAPGILLRVSIAVLSGFLLSTVLKAQVLPANPLTGSAGSNLWAKGSSEVLAGSADARDLATVTGVPVRISGSTSASGMRRRITL